MYTYAAKHFNKGCLQTIGFVKQNVTLRVIIYKFIKNIEKDNVELKENNEFEKY